MTQTSNTEKPKFKFTVNTYWYDQTGYYIGHEAPQEVIVYANSNVEAASKAKALRKDERRPATADTLDARIVNAEEIL